MGEPADTWGPLCHTRCFVDEETGAQDSPKVFSSLTVKVIPVPKLNSFSMPPEENFQGWHISFSQSVSSIAQSCPTLCDPMNHSTPGLPIHHQLSEFTQTHVHQVGDAIQPSHILCHPLLLLPPIPPRIRVFSNESALRIRWPKYWSFSFNISPSNGHPGVISLGWTGWISLQSKGLSRVFSNTTVQKHQFLSAHLSSQSNSHIHT